MYLGSSQPLYSEYKGSAAVEAMLSFRPQCMEYHETQNCTNIGITTLVWSYCKLVSDMPGLLCRADDQLAGSTIKVDRPVSGHAMQHIFGSDSVQAMKTALSRFQTRTQEETEDSFNSSLLVPQDSSMLPTDVVFPMHIKASALARIAGTAFLMRQIGK